MLKILNSLDKKGLSQSGLAIRTILISNEYNKTSVSDKTMPITQASIARWEVGENTPSIDNLVILARVLNVSLPKLIEKNFEN